MDDSTAQSSAAAEQTATRGKRSGRTKLSPFNKFLQTELQRLMEEYPDWPHQERFKLACLNWKKQQEKEKA